MAVIPFLKHLICRPDPIDTLIQSARPHFQEYIGTDHAHAARTIYLVSAVVAMGKAYSAEAEEILQRELGVLCAHLDTKSGDAYRLAQWVLDLDDLTLSDALNRLVPPGLAKIRMARLQEAVNQV